MSQDEVQNTINVMSLVLQQDADVARACKEANLPPSLVTVLLKMHGSQRELENAINEMRKTQLVMAKLIDQTVNFHTDIQQVVMDIGKKVGFDQEELVKPEERN
jgi:hypothetical protein